MAAWICFLNSAELVVGSGDCEAMAISSPAEVTSSVKRCEGESETRRLLQAIPRREREACEGDRVGGGRVWGMNVRSGAGERSGY